MNQLIAAHDFLASLADDQTRYQVVLNGVIGDLLAKHKSRMAIGMAFYSDGDPLLIAKPALKKTDLPKSGKICILAHGSCNSERDWRFQNDVSLDYGKLLQKDLGHTPFYLRYNSGLHISTNGKRLSSLLEKLVNHYPTKVTEIMLLGHSMGGLVFRSACYYGKKEKKKWVRLVKKIFYLGSPHFGTHFEKFGKLTSTILRLIPTIPTNAIAAFIDLRSAGIKDLRHGYITHQDWQKKNADDLFYVHQNKTPLLKTAEHYLVCGTISKKLDSKVGRLFGDGMVHPGSGTGQGLLPSSRIAFPKDHCKVFPGISHYNLLKSQQVYQQIKSWS
jgi:triacylglycerol lipase